MSSKPSRWVAVTLAVASVCAALFGGATAANAISAVDWDPGYIVSDAVFFNTGSMSQAQIQSWLESKETGCTTTNSTTLPPCLKTYQVPTYNRAATSQCSPYAGAQELASAIIWKVSQACGINPQVLLVMLEKEQGLVTTTTPTAGRYNIAMGYGCPDTAGCDPSYFTFYNQVYSAAKQLKEYTIHPTSWRYKVGANTIQFNPNPACGSSVVTIRNQATADLYNYTPYQPNAGALANLTGTADCGAYGNRNFWVYFNNWFGSPVGKINPVGVIDGVQAVPGSIHVSGWAFDPDTNDPIPVAIYVNGQGITVTASNSRPDVGAIYGVGAAHGYDQTIANVGTGPQQVCVYAINYGPGANTPLGCNTVYPMTGNPVGVLDSVSVIGNTITTSGWVFDPDTVDSIPVHIYVDTSGTAYTANQSRPDVAAIYPGYGAAHGYSYSVTAAPGSHTVCAYGINAGPGVNSSLGCRVVTVQPNALPLGVVDAFTVSPGQVTVSGWAFDPDTTASTPVAVYVDTTGAAFTANGSRPDVAAVYGHGAAHGYTASMPTPPGVHSVCVFAIDATDPAAHTGIRCQTITAMSGSPVGVVDSIAVSGGAIVASGWVYDPDTTQSAQIRVTVDGVSTTSTASNSRPDVAAAYPPYGAAHGYSVSATTAAGSHQVCVYGVNSGYGSDSLLGCSTLTL